MALLKRERFRWHPARMGQRFAGIGTGALEGELKMKDEKVSGIVQKLPEGLVGGEERSAGLR